MRIWAKPFRTGFFLLLLSSEASPYKLQKFSPSFKVEGYKNETENEQTKTKLLALKLFELQEQFINGTFWIKLSQIEKI